MQIVVNNSLPYISHTSITMSSYLPFNTLICIVIGIPHLYIYILNISRLLYCKNTHTSCIKYCNSTPNLGNHSPKTLVTCLISKFQLGPVLQKYKRGDVAILAKLLAQLLTHSFGMHKISLSTDPCVTFAGTNQC